MKQKIGLKKYLMLIVIAGGISLLPVSTALAGDINGEEARVIAVASGTFEYNGETYRAKSSYISQLQEYLASDDVDLTAAQADSAISEIYSNIAVGVESGYLYKVSGGEEETAESTDTTEEETEETTEELTEETEEATEENKETTAPPTTASDTTEALIEQVEEQEAIGQLVYDEEEDRMIYYSPSFTQGIKLPSIAYPGEVKKYSGSVFIVQTVISGVILILLAVLIGAKCFPGQKKKRSRTHSRYYVNHKRRKQIRYLVGFVFTGLLAIEFCVGFFLAGIRISLFRNAFVQDHLTSSGYYRYIYNSMLDNLESELSLLPDKDRELLLEPVTYDRFLNSAKAMVQASLEGFEASYDSGSLEEKLDLQAEKTELPKEAYSYIKNGIISNMKSYTADVVGSSIYGLRLWVNDILRGNLWLYFVNMVCMLVILVAMDRYRHRGVRYISRAALIGAGLVVLCSGILLLWKPYAKLRMDPEYLFLFIVDYMQRGMIIVFVAGIIGIIIGLLLNLLMKYLRQQKIAET